MLADREGIERRLPHAGNMCLLDGVIAVSDSEISCRATSHRDPDNPLRSESGLPTTAALEYAAQAMAVHANWSAKDNALRQGVLAAAHDFEIFVDQLNNVDEIITVNAQHLGSTENGFMYSFVLLAGIQVLASGRATIMYIKNDDD